MSTQLSFIHFSQRGSYSPLCEMPAPWEQEEIRTACFMRTHALGVNVSDLSSG